MPNNHPIGDAGEQEIVDLIPCPNCSKRLMRLPTNYPLHDIQCTGCHFRVQVKSITSKPKSEILGAGWDIMDKVLKSGHLMPPLITNFKWGDKNGKHQEVRFYPFIPKKNLKKRQLSSWAHRANYKMFNYVGLDVLPYFILFQK